jgi:hypothetical protein
MKWSVTGIAKWMLALIWAMMVFPFRLIKAVVTPNATVKRD